MMEYKWQEGESSGAWILRSRGDNRKTVGTLHALKASIEQGGKSAGHVFIDTVGVQTEYTYIIESEVELAKNLALRHLLSKQINELMKERAKIDDQREKMIEKVL